MSDSSIRRREFVAGAAAAATSLAITSQAIAGGNNSLCNLTSADFVPLIGQSFVVDGTREHGTQQRGTLVLKEVVRHASDDRPAHLRSEGFSLRFESRDATLANGTHRVTGVGFHPQAIYLHEMLDQRAAGLRSYEAVFN